MKLIKELGTKRGNSGDMQKYGLFLCQRCGLEVERPFTAGLNGKTCGCKRRESLHSKCDHRIYKVWNSMKQRCCNPNIKIYKWYGGRGIRVCDEWLDFNPFLIFAESNGYKIGLELDRIDNNGNYEPGNCRFVDHTTNVRNSRTVKLSLKEAEEIRMIYKKSSLSQRQVAKLYNVSSLTINFIVNNKTWV